MADTNVNQLIINKLTKTQYENIQNPSETELYLIPDEVDTTPTADSTNPITSGSVKNALDTKQNTLVSGTNIKTINNQNILGSGNIDVKDIFVVTYDVTPFADILAAYNAGKLLIATVPEGGIIAINTAFATEDDSSYFFFSSFMIYEDPLSDDIGMGQSFYVTNNGNETVYSNGASIEIQAKEEKVSTIIGNINNNKFPTTQAVVDYAKPLPFIVNVGINPSDVISVNKTLTEIETAYNDGKQIKVKFASASGIAFESDLIRVNNNSVITYSTHIKLSQFHQTEYYLVIYNDSSNNNITTAEFTEISNNVKQDSMGLVQVAANTSTLSPSYNKYYNFAGEVNTLTINLPYMQDGMSYVQTIIFNLTCGSTPNISINGYEVNNVAQDVVYFTNYILHANKSYEINALWNGTTWIIGSNEIDILDIPVPPIQYQEL